MITHSSYDIRSRDILSALGWKDFYERRQDHLATFMFKTINAKVPQYISKMSIKSSDVHSYSLRHAQDSLSFQDQIAKLSNIVFPIEGHFVGIV